MRVAFISDIHSNLEALRAVLALIDKLGTDKTVCLGDVVGYNSNPNECVNIIRDRSIVTVMGNHDSRAAGIEEATVFNPVAAEAVLWTRGALTDENRTYLARLPRSVEVTENILAVHGSIDDTDTYILSVGDAKENFSLLRVSGKGSGKDGGYTCFFGHTHQGVIYTAGAYTDDDGTVTTTVPSHAERLNLSPDDLYLINPGSVGQPRDGDRRASFALMETKKREITWHRVDYDFEETGRKIVAAGLPGTLAKRLRGGW